MSTNGRGPGKSGRVHFFHGDKGGVGKSFVCMSFVDWLVRQERTSVVVDCDMRNPDVARMFAKSVPTHTIDLRGHEGWLELLSLLHESEAGDVVVSLPAGIGAEVAEELPVFLEGCRELRREVTLLWTLGRTPDSINLLRPALEAFSTHAKAMVVLKNLFFGDADRFGRWNGSKTAAAFTDAGGVVVEFPDLLDRLVDQTAMANPPVPFSHSLPELRFGDRSELRRWLGKVDRLWDGLAGKLGVA